MQKSSMIIGIVSVVFIGLTIFIMVYKPKQVINVGLKVEKGSALKAKVKEEITNIKLDKIVKDGSILLKQEAHLTSLKRGETDTIKTEVISVINYEELQTLIEEFRPFFYKLVKEIEDTVENSKDREYLLMYGIKEYFSHYVDLNNIDQLITLESELAKKGEEDDSFRLGSEYIGVRASNYLEEYPPWGKIPVIKFGDKIFEIISNSEIHDSIRRKYIYDIDMTLSTYYNAGKKISKESKERLISVLMDITQDKMNNTTRVRAAASHALTLLAEDQGRVIDVLISCLDEEDEVKIEILRRLDIAEFEKDDRIEDKLLSMLENEDNYSKVVIKFVRGALSRRDSERVVKVLIEDLEKIPYEEFASLVAFLHTSENKEIVRAILKNSSRFPKEKDYWIGNLKVKALGQIIDEGNEEYLTLAIQALGECSYYDAKDAVETLIRKLGYNNPSIRIAVAKALGQIRKILFINRKSDIKIIKEMIYFLTRASGIEKDESVLNVIQETIDEIKSKKGNRGAK